jgi:hypothetical protein
MIVKERSVMLFPRQLLLSINQWLIQIESCDGLNRLRAQSKEKEAKESTKLKRAQSRDGCKYEIAKTSSE